MDGITGYARIIRYINHSIVVSEQKKDTDMYVEAKNLEILNV